MTTPHETELKLELPAHQIARLRQLPLLRQATPAKSEALLSVYYDTKKRKLRKRGLSLRVRRVDDRYLQTVKKDGGKTVGLFDRKEWQHEIAGHRPDLDGSDDAAVRSLIGRKVRRNLRPVFTTRVQRQIFPICKNGSAIEITVDHGKVEVGTLSSPLCELELELKEGEPEDLFAIARSLGREVSLRPASGSKDELGYALIDGAKSQPVKAVTIALTAESSAATAFRVIARACLYQLVVNESVLRRNDLEAAHQMRVALRRLRSSISLFSDMLDGRQTETMKSRLKWLTTQLDPVRELDVFVKHVIRKAEKPDARGVGTGAAAKDFRDRRARALAEVQKVVASARFRRLVLDLVSWIEIGDWTRDEAAQALRQQPVVTAAAKELQRRTKKIRKQGVRLAELAAPVRHKFRIKAKKLRYACEFFGCIFPGKKSSRRRKQFTAQLKKLQGALGDLNDIVVHEDLAKQLALAHADRRAGRRRPIKEAFAAGRLAGGEEARFAATMAEAESAYSAFVEAKPFWR